MNNTIKRYTVNGIGEVLWDMLPDGKILGGAPVNFAYHASQLGAVGVAISSVGDDGLGHEIMDSVDAKGVENCIAGEPVPHQHRWRGPERREARIYHLRRRGMGPHRTDGQCHKCP